MISLGKWISWLAVVLCISVECAGFDGSCCQQGCINTVAGIRCVCRRGFRLINRCHCRGKLWWLQTFKSLYVLLNENAAGLALLRRIKIHRWLGSARDARIKSSLLSVINSANEILKLFHEFVHMCLAVQHRKILMTKMFSRVFFRLFKVNCWTKRRRIRNDEFCALLLEERCALIYYMILQLYLLASWLTAGIR